MKRPLPALPYGFTWRPLADGGGELVLWGHSEMASVQPLEGGGWLVRVNIAFHESLHREAIARSKGQACYWVHRWVAREAEVVYRTRPEECSFKAMGVSAKYPLAALVSSAA